MLIIHVRSAHILRQHAGEWRPAAQSFRTIAAIHVRVKRRGKPCCLRTFYIFSKITFVWFSCVCYLFTSAPYYSGVMSTTRYSNIVLSPQTPMADELEGTIPVLFGTSTL